MDNIGTLMTTFSSDDYIGGTCVELAYYYGYEASKCTVCGNFNESEYCSECDDADRDWCFTVRNLSHERIFVKTYRELGAENMFDLRDCFIRGVMSYVESLKEGQE
jgi:hypothetical protein